MVPVIRLLDCPPRQTKHASQHVEHDTRQKGHPGAELPMTQTKNKTKTKKARLAEAGRAFRDAPGQESVEQVLSGLPKATGHRSGLIRREARRYQRNP
jgi:hypothetical protein